MLFGRIINLNKKVVQSTIIRSFAQVTTNNVELTSVRYKDVVKRGSFAKLEDADISYFKSALDENRVVTEPSDLESHNVDWLHMVRGLPPFLNLSFR